MEAQPLIDSTFGALFGDGGEGEGDSWKGTCTYVVMAVFVVVSKVELLDHVRV